MGEVVGLSYKARYVQNVLEELERVLPGEKVQAILARADQGFLAHVRRATPVENVAGKPLVELFGVMRAELGDERYIAWWRDYTLQLVRIPLLKSLTHGIIKVLGLTPHAIFKNLPRARGSLVRFGGSITYEHVDDTSARMSMLDYPKELLASGIAGITMRGVYEGVLSFAGHSGSAVVVSEDADTGTVVHLVKWIPR
jgi:hypothetical protein